MAWVTGNCAVDGCGRTGVRIARGMCMIHYERWRKYSDPAGGGALKGEPLAFLMASLSHHGDDCLIWPYARLTNGYPSVYFEGRSQIASRVICRLVRGEPPTPEHEAAHSCGRGHLGCINPDHLDWATPAANQADRQRHGTTNRGSRQGQSKLTEADVIAIIASPDEPQQVLAARFGVTPANIRKIRLGESWGWLTRPAKEIAA